MISKMNTSSPSQCYTFIYGGSAAANYLSTKMISFHRISYEQWIEDGPR